MLYSATQALDWCRCTHFRDKYPVARTLVRTAQVEEQGGPTNRDN